VTLGGAAVAGEVTFIGADNTSVSNLILPDGTYTIANPPKGRVKVVVKGTGMPTPPAKGQPPGVKAPEMVGGTAPAGVPPPPKYANPDNGTTFEVTGGQQTFDIELKP